MRELLRREALILGFGCARVISLVAFGWLRILWPSEGHCCPAGAAGGWKGLRSLWIAEKGPFERRAVSRAGVGNDRHRPFACARFL